jgi:hypothetical protein
MLLVAQSQWAGRRRDDKPSGVKEVDIEDIRDDSLDELKASHSGAAQYQIKGNDFESIPEIHKSTSSRLKARGIMNLFPVQ